MIAPRISMVSGVGTGTVGGQQKYAVRVQVDPDKLKAQGIGLNEIDQALQSWNSNVPTGQLFGPNATYNIRTSRPARRTRTPSGRSSSPTGGGAPVRLGDIANVLDSVENTRTAAWMYRKGEEPRREVFVHSHRSSREPTRSR